MEYFVIISFSTDWEQAYREVCQTGSTQSYRVRINIIGYYRAGKSSFLRRLLGKPFLQNIESTEGIHIVRIKTTYDNTHKVLGPWQKSILQTDDITQDFNDMLKDIIDVRMKITGTEKSSSTEPESSPATSTKHDTSSATSSNHYTILTSTEHATSSTMSSEQDTSHDTSTVHDTSPVASTEHDTRDAANTEHVTSPASSTEHDTSHATSTEHDTRDAANTEHVTSPASSTEHDTSHATSTEHDTSPATSTEHAVSPTTNIEDASNITSTEHDTSHTSTEQDTSHDTSTGHDASHDTGTEHDTSPTTDTDFDASQATATEHNNSHDRSTEHNMSAVSSTEHDTISVTGTEQNTSPATIIQHDTSQAISTEHENMPTTRIEHVTSSTISNELHTSQVTSTEHDTSHVTGGEHDTSSAASTKPDTSSASTEQNTSPVTSAKPDTSSATGTEHDIGPASTAHDTSPATSTEHDTSFSESTEHDISPPTCTEHEASYVTSTEHDTSHDRSIEHDTSHATSTEHLTSTEHDTSPATNAEHDTSPPTSTEHDTSPTTSAEHDTSHDRSTEHEASHATSIEHYTSHDTSTEHDTSLATGTKNETCPATSTEHAGSTADDTSPGKSTEQHTNDVTKTEHDTSPGTSTEEDTNQDTSIEHDTSHATSDEHDTSHDTSTEHDTSHDDAHKEQTKKPEGENNKSKFYDGADEQEKKSSKPKLSWVKEEKLQAHVIFENVDPSSLDIRLDSRSKQQLLELRNRSYRKREFKDTTQCLLSTWDFGGQVEYYATHHLFLDALAVNLITMDVTKGIHDVIPSQFNNTSTASIPKTVGQFLDYWLSTICKKAHSQGTEPSIAIILTHIDEIDNVKWSVDDYISDIIQYTRNKPYSEYVNRTNIFPVNNKDGDAQQFPHLRKEIFEKARRQRSWGLDRPTRWLKLEAEIYEEAKRKQLKYIDVTKIIELAANFGIDEKETHNFLTFHHVMGDLVHFNEENLSNLVIIDPQWLVDMFKAIITPHDFITRRFTADMPLKEFQQSALLTQELLEILWEGNDVQFLINLMQNFDLIIPVHHQGIQKYLVPCMLPPHKSDMYETQPFKSMIMVYSSFYIKPRSNFILIGDLHRILVICSRIDNWRLCDFDHLTYTDTSFKLQKGVRVAFSLVKQGRPETEAIRVTVWYSKEAIRKGALCLLPPTHRNIMNSMESLFELKNGSFLLACPDTLFDNDRNNHADMNFRAECMIPVRINPNDTLQLEESICPIHKNSINESIYWWFLYPSLAQTSAINDSPASSLTSPVIGR